MPNEVPVAASPFPPPILFPPSSTTEFHPSGFDLSHLNAPPEFRRLNPIPVCAKAAKTDTLRIQVCWPYPVPPCRAFGCLKTVNGSHYRPSATLRSRGFPPASALHLERRGCGSRGSVAGRRLRGRSLTPAASYLPNGAKDPCGKTPR